MSLLCLALRPLLARFAIDGPAFTSIFQGATRWQTYVALAVSGNLFGDTRAGARLRRHGRHHPAGQRAQRLRCWPNTPRRKSGRPAAIVMTVARNPLIWACAIGLALNVTHIPLPKLWHEVADALGRSSLAIGLLVTGAGLHLEGMFRPEPRRIGRRVPQAGADAGDRGGAGAVVRRYRFEPRHRQRSVRRCRPSSSAYVLARQMGGDAPLLAQIITLQTILAAVTMPIAIALAAMC